MYSVNTFFPAEMVFIAVNDKVSILLHVNLITYCK